MLLPATCCSPLLPYPPLRPFLTCTYTQATFPLHPRRRRKASVGSYDETERKDKKDRTREKQEELEREREKKRKKFLKMREKKLKEQQSRRESMDAAKQERERLKLLKQLEHESMMEALKKEEEGKRKTSKKKSRSSTGGVNKSRSSGVINKRSSLGGAVATVVAAQKFKHGSEKKKKKSSKVDKAAVDRLSQPTTASMERQRANSFVVKKSKTKKDPKDSTVASSTSSTSRDSILDAVRASKSRKRKEEEEKKERAKKKDSNAEVDDDLAEEDETSAGANVAPAVAAAVEDEESESESEAESSESESSDEESSSDSSDDDTRSTSSAQKHGFHRQASVPLKVPLAAHSNLKLVRNAIKYVCLANESMKDEREAALEILKHFKDGHFLILLEKQRFLRFLGIMKLDLETKQAFHLFGDTREIVEEEDVRYFLRYDSVQKKFTEMETKHLTHTTDAIILRGKWNTIKMSKEEMQAAMAKGEKMERQASKASLHESNSRPSLPRSTSSKSNKSLAHDYDAESEVSSDAIQKEQKKNDRLKELLAAAERRRAQKIALSDTMQHDLTAYAMYFNKCLEDDEDVEHLLPLNPFTSEMLVKARDGM